MLKFLKNEKSILSNSIKRVIATYLENKNLGEMTEFKLDSKKRDIYLTMQLKRELEPFKIIIKSYKFVKDGEDGYFTFDSIKTSRDWNSNTLEKIIGNESKRIDIPNKYVKIIVMFL